MSRCSDTREVTADVVREFLAYDPFSGVFTWRKQRKQMRPGDVAGAINNQRYAVIVLLGRQYQAHRLAWLHFYKEWPPHEVDHIDGNRSNNAIANLRIATHTQNCWNMKRGPKNITGYKGVSSDGRGGFRALIYKDGKKISLGTFSSPQFAHLVYCRAARRLFGEFWRAA